MPFFLIVFQTNICIRKRFGAKEVKMETRTLGSNLEVSAPGFGWMNIAWAYGSRTNKEDAVRLVRAPEALIAAHDICMRIRLPSVEIRSG